MYKIIGGDKAEYGPVTAEQIRQWIHEGRLNRDTQVQAEGATDWKPLGSFPEFASLLGAPATGGAASPSAPPTPAPSTPPAPTRTSRLAITSLVLGILGVFSCGITALFGLVLGIVALVKIKNSQGRVGGTGLAIGGIAVSGVMILMLPIFAAMLLPALAKAKDRAQTINCVNNLKQLGLAVRIYAADHDDKFPPADTWCDAIQETVGSPRVFQCPSHPGERCSYAYNRKVGGKSEKEINPQTVLFFENHTGWNAAGGPELFSSHNHSGNRIVVGFTDGSVQQLSRSQFDSLRWDP